MDENIQVFCICPNVKASISPTQERLCNGLSSNGSAHFQGYCSSEMDLFQDSRSNFILLESEITAGSPQQYSESENGFLGHPETRWLYPEFEGLVCNLSLLCVTLGALAFPMGCFSSCTQCKSSAWATK